MRVSSLDGKIMSLQLYNIYNYQCNNQYSITVCSKLGSEMLDDGAEVGESQDVLAAFI